MGLNQLLFNFRSNITHTYIYISLCVSFKTSEEELYGEDNWRFPVLKNEVIESHVFLPFEQIKFAIPSFTAIFTVILRFAHGPISSGAALHSKLVDGRCWVQFLVGRPNGSVVREAGCYTRGFGFESRVRHGCRAVRPWLHQ